jgi:thiamine biosynthesis lipoprotein
VGDLVNAWGFGPVRDEPDAAAIRAARQQQRSPCGQRLELDAQVIPPHPHTGCARKLAPMQIDLCGIAKGYAVDGMASVLKKYGIGHALMSLDGELRALGGQADGQPWPVALESPQIGHRAAYGVIEMADLAVATSGDYRRFMRVGDNHLAHSMDGRRGGPVNNGVASVTVLAATSMDADAWATALLVAGPEDGAILAQRHGLEVLMLLRREKGLVEIGFGRFQHP